MSPELVQMVSIIGPFVAGFAVHFFMARLQGQNRQAALGTAVAEIGQPIATPQLLPTVQQLVTLLHLQSVATPLPTPQTPPTPPDTSTTLEAIIHRLLDQRSADVIPIKQAPPINGKP